MQIDVFLIFLVASVFLNVFFGFFILSKNIKSISAQFLFLFCIVNAIWATVSYFYFFYNNLENALILVRSIIFLATFQALSILYLVKSFPLEEYKIPKYYNFGIFPLGLIVSLLCYTNLFFTSVHLEEGIYKADTGILMPIFGIFSISIVVLSLCEAFLKFKRSKYANKIYIYLFSGLVIMFSAIIVLNFIVPLVFNYVSFVAISPAFTLPFVFFAFYGILNEKTYDIKTITTEIFVYLYWAATFFYIFFVTGYEAKIFITLLFIGSIFLGQMIIKSVRKEVDEKERVLKLNKKIEQQNKKIALQKTSLEELLRMKEETLHIVNHQINTPIYAIRSAVAMFQDKMWTQERFLDVVNVETKRITETVGQFLAARKVDDGKLIINKTLTDYGTLVKTMIDEKNLLKKVRENNVHIVFNEPENIPPVKMDMPKITEVVSNLLDNAINYSTKDILVELKREGNNVVFSVKDSGIGIPKDKVNDLFKRFSRLENAKKVRPDGTGLGLYVCRQIAEGHKGTLWAKSEGEGMGSTFSLSLPIN